MGLERRPSMKRPRGPSGEDSLRLEASQRSNFTRSCCSEHEPPPHWLKTTMPPYALHLIGTLLALLAGLFLTVGGLLISKVHSVKPLEISAIRSFMATIYLIPALAYFRPKHDFDRGSFFELLGVSLIFSCKFITFTVGSTLLPLSEFSLLCNTVPVFTAVLGCLLLSERCGLREFSSCTIVMMGVATTFVPNLLTGDGNLTAEEKSRRTQMTEGYLITATSALTNAMALVWIRRLKEVHALLLTFYACAVTGIVSISAVFLLNQYTPPMELYDLLLIAGAGACMLMQALLPAIACSLTQASRVAVAMTFSVIFSFLLQVLFQGVELSLYSILGGILIVIAMVVGNTPCGNDDDSSEELLKSEEGIGERYGSLHGALR